MAVLARRAVVAVLLALAFFLHNTTTSAVAAASATATDFEHLDGYVLDWRGGGESRLVAVESSEPIAVAVQSLVGHALLSDIRKALDAPSNSTTIALACPALLPWRDADTYALHLNVRVRTTGGGGGGGGGGSELVETWRHPCIRGGVYECSSVLYSQLLDRRSLEPVGTGRVVPMPEPRGMPGGFAPGPEDARTLAVRGVAVEVFNFPAVDVTDRSAMLWGGVDPGRHMYFSADPDPQWRAETDERGRGGDGGGVKETPARVLVKPRIVRVRGGNDMAAVTETVRLRQFEKNWSPFDLNGSLHFVRTFAPLQIVRCPPGFPKSIAANAVDGDKDGGALVEYDCELVHGDDDENAVVKGEFHVGSLRGGSPFVPWAMTTTTGDGNGGGGNGGRRYFVSVAHSTTAFAGRHFYRMHAVVLQVEPVFSLVYVSGPLQLPTRGGRTGEDGDGDTGQDGWWPLRPDWLHLVEFASSLELEDGGATWVVGCHVNDQVPLLARFRGLGAAVDEAIHVHGLLLAKRQGQCSASNGGTVEPSCEGTAAGADGAAALPVGSQVDEQALVERAVQEAMHRHAERRVLRAPPQISDSSGHDNGGAIMAFVAADGEQHEFGLWKGAPADDVAELLCGEYLQPDHTRGCARLRRRVRDLTGRLNAGAPMGEWLSLPQPLQL